MYVLFLFFFQNNLKEKANFLERAKLRNERDKRDVDRYYERKRHMDTIELLVKKRAWQVSVLMPYANCLTIKI